MRRIFFMLGVVMAGCQKPEEAIVIVPSSQPASVPASQPASMAAATIVAQNMDAAAQALSEGSIATARRYALLALAADPSAPEAIALGHALHHPEAATQPASQAASLAASLPTLVDRIRTLFAAHRYEEAASLAMEVVDPAYVERISVTFVSGCRGTPDDNTPIFAADSVPKALPRNACVGRIVPAACVTDCGYPQLATQRAKREAARRARLGKLFPQGPYVIISLPAHGAAGLHAYYYAREFDVREDASGFSGVSIDLKQAQFDDIPLPTGDAPLKKWFDEAEGEAYGVVVAANEAAAHDTLDAYVSQTNFEGLVPQPAVVDAPDVCDDCKPVE